MKLSREKNLRKASPSPFVFCNQSLLSDLFIITGSRFFFSFLFLAANKIIIIIHHSQDDGGQFERG